jgi:hypothetical protein
LQTPRASHRDFPETVQRVADQVEWALAHIQHNGKALLEEAQYGDAAAKLDPAMVQTALNTIRTHLAQQGDLRAQAIEEKLITM